MNEQEQPKCSICDNDLAITWTDTHGVAACCSCGAPYRILHYEDDRRVEKPRDLLVKTEWIPLLKQYWGETKRMAPHGFDMGILGGRRSTYSGLTEADFKSFNKWCAEHRQQIDALKGQNTP